jgi:hypothetical protein
MERSDIRAARSAPTVVPDFALLNPGYIVS